MQCPIICPLSSSPRRGDLDSFNFAQAVSRRAIERIRNQMLGALTSNDLDLKVAVVRRIGYVGRTVEELRWRYFELEAEHPSGWDVCSGISSPERREPVVGVCESRALTPVACKARMASGFPARSVGSLMQRQEHS
jgi:hypothetical protein